jgi:hypothetical protein
MVREMTPRRRFAGPMLALACAALVLVFSGCGDLSRDELNRGVESLAAIAAQGQLVANGVARDATKSTYARVMSKTLGGEAEHEAEKIADAEPEDAVAPERHAAVRIAGELAALFTELQTFPGDEHHGALIEKHLGEVEEQANAVVARLTGEPQ